MASLRRHWKLADGALAVHVGVSVKTIQMSIFGALLQKTSASSLTWGCHMTLLWTQHGVYLLSGSPVIKWLCMCLLPQTSNLPIHLLWGWMLQMMMTTESLWGFLARCSGALGRSWGKHAAWNCCILPLDLVHAANTYLFTCWREYNPLLQLLEGMKNRSSDMESHQLLWGKHTGGFISWNNSRESAFCNKIIRYCGCCCWTQMTLYITDTFFGSLPCSEMTRCFP